MTNATPSSAAQPRPSIWTWLDRLLLTPHPSITGLIPLRQARLSATIAIVTFVTTSLAAIFTITNAEIEKSLGNALGAILAIMATLVGYFFARTRTYKATAYIITLSLYFSAFLQVYTRPNLTVLNFTGYIISNVIVTLIVASGLLSTLELIGYTILLFITTSLAPQLTGGAVDTRYASQIAGAILTNGIILVIIFGFRNRTEQQRVDEIQSANQELAALTSQLEERITERTRELSETNLKTSKRAEQLATVAELSRSIASIQAIDTLLETTTLLISERLGFYHVGIFLVDEKNMYAVLRAANSENGKRMIARGHRLRVGETGIVGLVTSLGRPRISLNVGVDAIYFDNPDLPDTRSEMALPLRIGANIIGALDIQSAQPQAFTDEDITILSILADQIAIAIQNALSFERAERAAKEAESATREMVTQAWKEFRDQLAVTSYRFNGIRPEPLKQSADIAGKPTALKIPVQLRGQKIGNLIVNPSQSDSRRWTDDEVSMARAAAERVALALENARLLSESRERAAKEQTISQASARISAALDIEQILKTTAGELEKALGSSEIIIHIDDKA